MYMFKCKVYPNISTVSKIGTRIFFLANMLLKHIVWFFTVIIFE